MFANGGGVLLLDEPFGALDYVTGGSCTTCCSTLWAETDKGQRRTVMFVTHDVDEAMTLADRILVFQSGAGRRRHR